MSNTQRSKSNTLPSYYYKMRANSGGKNSQVLCFVSSSFELRNLKPQVDSHIHTQKVKRFKMSSQLYVFFPWVPSLKDTAENTTHEKHK